MAPFQRCVSLKRVDPPVVLALERQTRLVILVRVVNGPSIEQARLEERLRPRQRLEKTLPIEQACGCGIVHERRPDPGTRPPRRYRRRKTMSLCRSIAPTARRRAPAAVRAAARTLSST